MTFTLLSELGRGGMGVVWRARDEETGAIVALKLLRAAYADDPDYLERFTRELELTRRIHSAHVVAVLGYGVREGVPYLALEYVDGPSLRELLATHGPYGWPEARGLLAQVAQGLADAHAAGIVHRDVKPSNILLGSDGVAKLTDFGVSRGLDLTRVTGTSTMLGTPAYLAPEGPADERSDLYSLGCVAYELLAGAVPFEGRSYQEVILRHVREAPDLAKLPAEARAIVGALLAKEPAGRPGSAAELVGLLAGTTPLPVASGAAPARATPAPGTSRRRRGALLAAAALAVALLLVAVETGLTAHPGASPSPGAPGASLAAVVVGSSVPSQAGGSPSAGLTPAAASPSAGASAGAAGTPGPSATVGPTATSAPRPTALASPHATLTPYVPPNVQPNPTPYVPPYVPPTPTATPLSPPAAPSNIQASALDQNRILVTWSNNATNATGITISDNLTSVTLGAGATSYTWTGLAPGTYKCSHVYAFNAAGNSSWTGWACTTTIPAPTPTATPLSPPAAPSNIQASALDQNRILVTWSNNATNATGITISDNLTSVTLGAGATSYTWTGLAPSTYKCSHVYAFNAAGNSSWTGWACTTTIPAPTPTATPLSPPAAPSNIQASALDQNRILVTWSNNATNATGITISDNLTSVTLGAGATSYTWTGLAPSTYKCSHVYAFNAAGNSSWTGWACTTTPSPSPSPSPIILTGSIYMPASAGPWTNTGVSTLVGDAVRITATGTYGVAGSDPGKTPASVGCAGTAGSGAVAPNLQFWAPIGKIGSASPFCIGASVSFVATSAGELYTVINDDVFSDNWGGVTISWTITRP